MRKFMHGDSENSRDEAKRPITAAFIRVGESRLPEHWRKELGLRPGATWFDAMVAGMFRAAAKGDPGAAREIREAVEGTASTRIERLANGRTRKILDRELPEFRAWVNAIRTVVRFHPP